MSVVQSASMIHAPADYTGKEAAFAVISITADVQLTKRDMEGCDSIYTPTLIPQNK